ncbi:Fe-S protein assembly co-chaperone HscB [Bacteroidia bacterium]|nr:Fe-S protein assembly co-chaperone HscB [Bacteroidia bacterium]
MSRKNHPDFFINDEEKYLDALAITALNNEAYKTLKCSSSLIKYILELNGVLQESGNQLPSEFLMEMMDINEAIMDVKMEPNALKTKKLIVEVAALEDDLQTTMNELTQKCDEAKEKTGSFQDLEELKEIYLKMKYVLRIKESLNTFA